MRSGDFGFQRFVGCRQLFRALLLRNVDDRRAAESLWPLAIRGGDPLDQGGDPRTVSSELDLAGLFGVGRQHPLAELGKPSAVLYRHELAKTLLDHALRQAGNAVTFSRKVSLRSLGDATRTTIEQYIHNQIPKARYVDPETETLLSQFTVRNPHVDLSLPTETNSGRYWYNLHLVLVTAERQGCFDTAGLKKIRDGCSQIAAKKGYLISIESAVPDHLLC